MAEIEIGTAKRGRRAYSFDDIAIVPSRRTRDPEEVSTHWQIDAYRFDLPVVAAPMDSVMSPATVIEVGRHGGLGVLDLEGLWTRYEDPENLLAEIASLDPSSANARMQEIYAEPIKPELIRARLQEIRDAGVTVAGALSPQRTKQFADVVVEAGVDLFVIRGTTVSAEHVSGQTEPLNLKEFIYELDVPVIVGGCATYQAALHLMRTGAAGVLVGFGGGAAHTTRSVLGVAVPMASAVADVAAARRDYLDESGGRYVHVIADGSIGRSGDIAKAIACGADAVMIGSPFARATEAPGRGFHWGAEAWHSELPARGARRVRHHRLARVGPVRPLVGSRRHDEPHRRPASSHGHHRLHRAQGVPTGRSRRLVMSPLPQHPGSVPGPADQQKDRTVDVVMAWILWCLLLGGAILWAMLLFFFGAIVGPLACPGGESNEQLRSGLCDGDGATVARVGFIAQWIVLAVAVLGSLVATVLATTRRRLAWIWPALGIVLVIVAALAWWMAAVAVTS